MSAWVTGLASGTLTALALPPFHLWPLAFVSLVPLAWFLAGPRAKRRDATRTGIGFGVAFYGLLLHWVPFTLSGMMPLGGLVGILGVGILVGIAGMQGVALEALIGGRPARSFVPVLALPAVWISAELLLARAGPLAVPWTPLGLSLGTVPHLAGLAEWVGTRGLGFWLALVNGLLVCAVRAPGGRRAATLTVVALAGVLVPAGVGLVRARTLPTFEAPPILVGRMELPRAALLDPDRRNQEAAMALERMAAQGREAIDDAGDAPILAVLPEAPFAAALSFEPGPSPGPRSSDGVEAAAAFESLAAALGLPLLVGAHLRREGEISNAVVMVEGEAGSPAVDEGPRAVHSKRRLVPGVERPGLRPGSASDVLTVGGVGLALAICFESAFGRDVRGLRRDGAELLVNPTNDGWFVPRPFGGLSAAHLQHRAHLRLRSIETRMGAVRVPLGGELLVVSPTGHLTHRIPPGGESFEVVRPRSSRILTGYVRSGDLAGPLALLLLLALPFVRPVGSEPVREGAGYDPGGR